MLQHEEFTKVGEYNFAKLTATTQNTNAPVVCAITGSKKGLLSSLGLASNFAFVKCIEEIFCSTFTAGALGFAGHWFGEFRVINFVRVAILG